MGSGERSEKVRTYNFPQERVTDHRVKHTSHDLDGVLSGTCASSPTRFADAEKRAKLEAQTASE